MENQIVAEIPLDKIEPSPFNHRRLFRGIDELAESIRAKGILSPLLARPKNGHYELVFGERRLRAAKLAQLKTAPVMVRDMSDQEVLEDQLIENSQRADVHPLEEADGFKELIDDHGYDVDKLVARTGKSKAYVYARLKLCQLAAGPRKAMLDDRLSPSIALYIARIPKPDLQEQATREVLGALDEEDAEKLFGYPDVPRLEPDDPLEPPKKKTGLNVIGPAEPLSARAAQLHIQRKYMLRLELAKFSIDDISLDEKAGACTTCAHRTGNQRELFSDVRSADVCTNPPCFEKKTQLAWERHASFARSQGQKVVEAKDATRVFSPHDGRTVAGNAPYVDPADEVPWDLIKDHGSKAPTWGKLLGKKHEVPTVLVQDGTGAPRELLERKKAIEILSAAGKVDKPTTPKKTVPSKASQKNEADEKAKREALVAINKRAVLQVLGELVDVAAKPVTDKVEVAVWRFVVATLLENIYRGEDVVCERRGVKYSNKACEAIAEKLKSAGELRAFVVELLAAGEASDTVLSTWTYASAKTKEDAPLIGLCKVFGVDWNGAVEASKKLAKEAEKAEAAADQAKAKKKAPAKKSGKAAARGK